MEQDVLTPDWVSATIIENSTRPSLRIRARQAAVNGLMIAKLRAQREKVGFVALPLGSYLQGIARLAEVSWESLCLLALANPMHVNEETATILARFGAVLGFDLRAFRAHCRVGMAELIEGAPIPVLVAYRGNGSITDPLLECEAALFELEAEWGDGQRQRVKRIEELIRNGFSQDLVDG